MLREILKMNEKFGWCRARIGKDEIEEMKEERERLRIENEIWKEEEKKLILQRKVLEMENENLKLKERRNIIEVFLGSERAKQDFVKKLKEYKEDEKIMDDVNKLEERLKRQKEEKVEDLKLENRKN